jgi:hypothetical protein
MERVLDAHDALAAGITEAAEAEPAAAPDRDGE